MNGPAVCSWKRLSATIEFYLPRSERPFYLLVVLLTGCLKFSYSRADSDALRWILGPTAWLTTLLTQVKFDYVAGAGYFNAGHDILIAPVCAGINFLIICYCMLAFCQMHHAQTPGRKLAMLAGLGLASYMVTVLVNAARIALSIQRLDSSFSSAWLSLESIHRIEGVSVYFLALSLIYCISNAIANRIILYKFAELRFGYARPPKRSTLMVPLFWYLLITLGIPLLRIPYLMGSREFVEHGATVVLIPMLIVLSYTAFRRSCTR
jgi:exosortase K